MQHVILRYIQRCDIGCYRFVVASFSSKRKEYEIALKFSFFHMSRLAKRTKNVSFRLIYAFSIGDRGKETFSLRALYTFFIEKR